MRVVLVAVVVWALRLCAAAAQSSPAAEADRSVRLDPVVVTASRVPQLLSEAPAAIGVVEKPDIQDARQTVGLDESLNRVPGVFVQNSQNFAQDFRIQIRGFGTRAAFGTREIRVLVDGLPETMPDGQTELDNIELGAVDRIEVLRGPASSLYGNAAGGVIQLFTEDAPDQPYAETRVTGGSNGLQKYLVKGGARAGAASFFIYGSYFGLDGYRDHSGTRSGIVNAKLRYDFSEQTDVTLLLNAVDSPQADDAGALTRLEEGANRHQANPANVTADAGESLDQERIGSVVHHRTDHTELSAYAYVLYRGFENRLATPLASPDAVTFHRLSPGLGARYTIDYPVLGWAQRLLLGVDVQRQDDARRRYANDGGERDALRLQQDELVMSVGPYVREAVYLLDNLEISGGVRYDNVHYDVAVDYPSTNDASGSRTMDQWSPGGGLRYSPRSWLSLFANAGTAFQVPTTTELRNPDGPGFNSALKPETATSYETGVRTEWAERVRAELVGFFIDIDDELVPFTAPSGRQAFRNAGRSRRSGVELDWDAMLLSELRWTNSFSWLRAEYVDYPTAAGRFDGNEEPGIPSWRLYEELRYQHSSGAFAALEAMVVDNYFVDDGNTVRSPSHELLNVRGGYAHRIGVWTFEPFLGLNNLTGAPYDGTVRLNQVSDGRFFEPAPGLNVYGGVSVSARL